MSFSAKTVRDAIVSILASQNTTTATIDLSTSLRTRVQTVSKGNFKDPVLNILYPAVKVQVDSISDEFFAIGNSSKRDITSSYIIRAATQAMTPDGAPSAEDECLQLAENLDNILRTYTDLSGTCSYSRITGVDFSFDENDATYVHVAEIKLEVENHGV